MDLGLKVSITVIRVEIRYYLFYLSFGLELFTVIFHLVVNLSSKFWVTPIKMYPHFIIIFL